MVEQQVDLIRSAFAFAFAFAFGLCSASFQSSILSIPFSFHPYLFGLGP